MTEQTNTGVVVPEGVKLKELQDERLRVRVELIKHHTVIIRSIAVAIKKANIINGTVDLPDYHKFEKLLTEDPLDYDQIESVIEELLERFGLKVCM